MGFAKADHLPGDLQVGQVTKMARTVLPFKLAATEEPMTAQSGLVLHGEFIHGGGLSSLVGSGNAQAGRQAGVWGARVRQFIGNNRRFRNAAPAFIGVSAPIF